RLHDAKPQVGWINLEFLSDLVELNFLAETRLWSAMATFGAAGWFVGESAATLIAVTGDVIRGGLQCSGVKRAGDSVRAVGTAVDQRLEMHSSDCAILFDAGFEFHQNGVAAAVTVKDFFARQANFDGPIKQKSRLGHHDLMIEW